MTTFTDERLEKALVLCTRIKGDARRNQGDLDTLKNSKAERRQWVESNCVTVFRPKLESAIETLN
jgi:hypothetical protein